MPGVLVWDVQFMGSEFAVLRVPALPIAAATGLLIPAGPVITFAIAAVFAKAGASTAALVTFVTSRSVFAAHRILIYELPMVCPSFLRLRVLSVLVLPFLAGLLAMAVGAVTMSGRRFSRRAAPRRPRTLWRAPTGRTSPARWPS